MNLLIYIPARNRAGFFLPVSAGKEAERFKIFRVESLAELCYNVPIDAGTADSGGLTMAEESESRSTHVIHEKGQVGEVIIADEVVAMIAGMAATEVEGVASMADNITRELISKLGRNSKGVRVEVGDDVVAVHLSLNIEFGYNIPETAGKVQERVVSAIESMIGFKVSTVDIKIAGVVVGK